MRSRVTLLGLDGATLDLLVPYARAGLLPHLASLLDEGAATTLTSTVPIYTVPAWTSCFTGVHPRRHGVLYWRARSPWLPWLDADGQALSMLPFDRFPMVWDAVNAGGGRCACIDIPLGFPAPAIDGIFTSGFMAPEGSSLLTHPAGLLDDVVGWRPEIVKDETSFELRADAKGRRRYLGALTEQMRLRQHLLATRDDDVDLLCMVNVVPDRLSHLDWAALDRLARDGTGEDELLTCWTALDDLIGDVRGRTTETIMIVSDHGFSPGPRFNIGRWLADVGVIDAPARMTAAAQRRLATLVPPRARQAIGATLRRRSGAPAHLPATTRGDVDVWTDDVDDRSCFVYLNPDRSAEWRAEMRDRIVDLARRGAGLPAGCAPFGSITTGEELFGTHDGVVVPDVVIVPAGDWILARDLVDERLLLPDDGESVHHINGVLIAAGPHVAVDAAAPAHIVDVFPTVLAALGFEAPPDLDGGRIPWIAPAGTRTLPALSTRSGDAVALDAAQQEELESHLQALGYLD